VITIVLAPGPVSSPARSPSSKRLSNGPPGPARLSETGCSVWSRRSASRASFKRPCF